MKKITILLVCLFGVLGSGYCQEKRLYDHYYLTMKAIKEGNLSDREFNKQVQIYLISS